MTLARKPLWTSAAVVDATGGSIEGGDGSVDRPLFGISIDSRTIQTDDVFFAIRGDRFDGHDFVERALDAGAGLAVVSRERAAEFVGVAGAQLIVPDVLAALEDLGRAARRRMVGRVIGVTGSVGKTGTKEALRHVLAPAGSVHAADKSFNNHWGVPLTLARMPQSTRFGVFEIGMNHAGEIRPLTRMVRPHVAIITTVQPVHLEFFESVAGIARAKAEIFEGIEPGGAVVLPGDNEHFRLLSELASARPEIDRVVVFGSGVDAEVRLVDAELAPDHSIVEATLFGRSVRYRLGVPGRHLIANSLAVLAATALAGADLDAAVSALADLGVPEGRGAQTGLSIGGKPATLIDESYNANPASMRAALGVLGQTAPADGGRRIAVMGDMLELGPSSGDLHAGLSESVVSNHVDRVYCCGPDMARLWERLPDDRKGAYGARSDDLVEPLLSSVSAGDVIMIKGSLGSRMRPLVDALLSRYGAVTSGGVSH